MTAIKGKDIDLILSNPSPTILGYLFFGPNSGLSVEYAENLIKKFRALKGQDNVDIIKPDYDTLNANPQFLRDEASAISFFSTYKIFHLSLAAKIPTEAIKNYIELGSTESILIISAQDIKSGTAIRTYFEKHKDCVAIASYADTPRNMRNLIEQHVKQEQYTIEPDALNFLSNLQGIDRLILRSELSKLILYTYESKHITLSDVKSINLYAEDISYSDIIDAAFSDNKTLLAKRFEQMKYASIEPQVLSTLALRHACDISLWIEEIKMGKKQLNEDDFREVFWSRRATIIHQIKVWQKRGSIKACIDYLNKTVLEARINYNCANEITSQALFKVCG